MWWNIANDKVTQVNDNEYEESEHFNNRLIAQNCRYFVRIAFPEAAS